MSTSSTRRIQLVFAVAVINFSCGGDDGTGPEPVPVATVEVSPPAATISTGETVQLAADLKDAAGNTLTDRSTSWSSSNAAIASVSAEGLVTGVTDGNVVVTATSEGKSGTAAITVHAPVAVVEVSPPSATILTGEELQLDVTTRDAAGLPLSDRVVTWSSSAPEIATVNSSGAVTGMGPGTATITATAEEQSGTSTVTVDGVLYVDGRWVFSEVISDALLELTCNNEAAVELTQTGATFTGSADQNGECIIGGDPFDNSGIFQIIEGNLEGPTITFVQPGEEGVECSYEGTLVGIPATSASGTVACIGFLGQTDPPITGTWQMTR